MSIFSPRCFDDQGFNTFTLTYRHFVKDGYKDKNNNMVKNTNNNNNDNKMMNNRNEEERIELSEKQILKQEADEEKRPGYVLTGINSFFLTRGGTIGNMYLFVKYGFARFLLI